MLDFVEQSKKDAENKKNWYLSRACRGITAFALGAIAIASGVIIYQIIKNDGDWWALALMLLPVIAVSVLWLGSHLKGQAEHDDEAVARNYTLLFLSVLVCWLMGSWLMYVEEQMAWFFEFSIIGALASFVFVFCTWLFLFGFNFAHIINLRDAANTISANLVVSFFAVFLVLTYFLAFALAADDNKGMGVGRALVAPSELISAPVPTPSEFRDLSEQHLPSGYVTQNGVSRLTCDTGASETSSVSSDWFRVSVYQRESANTANSQHFEILSGNGGVGNEKLKERLTNLQTCYGVKVSLQGFSRGKSGEAVDQVFVAHQSAIVSEYLSSEMSQLTSEKKFAPTLVAEVVDAGLAGSSGFPAAEKDGHPYVDLRLSPIEWPYSEAERPFLDYMYFMIYTITTTGYGDFRPNSPSAKFITSVANIIEVFFVVVFFNVLLTASQKPQG